MLTEMSYNAPSSSSAPKTLKSPTSPPSRPSRRKAKVENWDDDFVLPHPVCSATSQPASSKSPISPPPRTSRRRAKVENWDDDFEFSQPPRKSRTSISRPMEIKTDMLRDEGRSSPVDSFDGSWGDTPPGPSMNILPPASRPPRHSPSPASPSVPFFTTSPSPASPSADDIPQRTRLTSGPTTIRHKLIKRHPSASFTPPPDTPPTQPPMLSRPLPRSDSRERMPPPPLPTGLIRSKSRSKSRSSMIRGGLRADVRVSGIPFSPSQEQINEGYVEKKPGFWKRLSGMPAELKVEPTGHRRRRSSSVGAVAGVSTETSSPRPPVPPIPPNLRSPSAGSSTSNVSYSSSNRSGPVTALSSILRRSTSNLSKRSESSGRIHNPPTSYPYPSPALQNRSTSSFLNLNHTNSPIPMPSPSIPSTQADQPQLSTSRSFSRGFHLPSPSPQSPYHKSLPPLLPAPPLPHSASFPVSGHHHSRTLSETDTDFETEHDEAEGQHDTTPKKPKKPRPVSALPVPSQKIPEQNGWSGPTQTNQRSASRSSHRPTFSEIPKSYIGLENGLPSSKSSTFKRLGSLSKKHGRRLSGGFVFGNGNGNATINPEGVRRESILETVQGSPSKSSPYDLFPPSPPFSEDDNESVDEFRADFRAGSVSAPSSRFQPLTLSPVTAGEGSQRKSRDKEKRRQSWNDFVIPREVLEKQKGLKEGLGAVKKFAGGIKGLKELVDQHSRRRALVFAHGTEKDRIEFTRLESEFEQWWEMATVLIEVASTGQDDDMTPHPKRERRITLATGSDDAKLASRALSLRKLSNSTTPRKASLPDPEDISMNSGLSPPRGSPDQWRASTGRQDLSKRQLEVLRTMLRTPVSPPSVRPSINGRQFSMLSISNTNTNTPDKSTFTATERTPTHAHGSGVKFPSPPSSSYIVASGSFPTPGMAEGLARGGGGGGGGGKGKSGLVGLKDFLRSLKGGINTPTKVKTNTRPTRIRPNPVQTSIPTPITPSLTTFPATVSFEDSSQHSTTRSSFSALGPNSPVAENRNTTSRRVPSPVKNNGSNSNGKRPSLKNIFRSSSGNWSDLVKGGNGSNGPIPPLPTPKSGRNSSGGSGGVTKEVQVTVVGDSADEGGGVPEGEGESTVRPARRSRIMGLGLGTPTSPTSPTWQFPTSSQASGGGDGGGGMTMMDSPSFGSIGGEGAEGVGGEEEMVIALTPDNLPVLLEYLGQCRAKLGEWAVKAEELQSGGRDKAS